MYRSSLHFQQQELIVSISGAKVLISHSGEKGREIEEKIREALARVLPEKIGVSHGFVIDSNDNSSNQMDIVLYDKMNTPKIYDGDSVQIFPVESTYACGEVKFKLDSRELEDVSEKCLSYKNLHRKAYYPSKGVIRNTVKLFGKESEHWNSIFFCITYESINLEKLCEKLCKKYNLMVDREGSSSLEKRIDTIIAFNNPADHYNIILNAKIGAEPGIPIPGSIDLLPDPDSSICTYPAKHSWALFIELLLRYMIQAPPQIINMLEYNKGGPF